MNFILIALTKALILTSTGSHPIDLELAKTPQEHTVGLQNRDQLEPKTGMLFCYTEKTYTSFWMDHVHFPLAILFLNKDKKVMEILYGDPFSKNLIRPQKPYFYVLEISPNLVDQYQIKKESKLVLQ